MKVTRQEFDRFVAVCAYYRTPDAEVAEIKEAANRDPEGWRICFNTMWREIHAGK